MLQGEHSAILPTFIKLPFVFKSFALSIFEWPFKTGFTVHVLCMKKLSFISRNLRKENCFDLADGISPIKMDYSVYQQAKYFFFHFFCNILL